MARFWRSFRLPVAVRENYLLCWVSLAGTSGPRPVPVLFENGFGGTARVTRRLGRLVFPLLGLRGVVAGRGRGLQVHHRAAFRHFAGQAGRSAVAVVLQRQE